MSELSDRFEALVDEHGPDTTLPTADLLSIAAELQLAAILLRDLAEALPMSMRLSMPPTLAERLYATHYQDVLDEFVPEALKPAIKELIDLEPEIIRARAVTAL